MKIITSKTTFEQLDAIRWKLDIKQLLVSLRPNRPGLHGVLAEIVCGDGSTFRGFGDRFDEAIERAITQRQEQLGGPSKFPLGGGPGK